MNPGEFKFAVFDTPDQWRYGVGDGISFQDNGGISLFPYPVRIESRTGQPCAALTVGACGSIHWFNPQGRFYILPPHRSDSEPVVRFTYGPVDSAGIVDEALWVLVGSALLGLDRGNLQLVTRLDFHGVTRAAYDANGLAVADDRAVYLFDGRGQLQWQQPRVDGNTAQAVALSVDGVYLITSSGGAIRRLRRSDGQQHDAQPLRGELNRTVSIAVVTATGALVVAQRDEPAIHYYDPYGVHLGTIGVGAAVTSIQPHEDSLYVGTTMGIVVYDTAAAPLVPSRFCTLSLDSGIDSRELFHRLDLDADIAEGTRIEAVYAYAFSNEVALRQTIDRVLTDTSLTPRQRIDEVVQRLSSRWSEPKIIEPQGSIGPSPGFLFSLPEASDRFPRFVWVLLALSTLDPQRRPDVHRMRVVYPRQSYLRYLPAIYESNMGSDNFVERFLSVFETSMGGVADIVSKLHEWIDPDLTPDQFLPWLAGWLDISIDESWSENVVRQLLSNAFELYERKGTPQGVQQLLGIIFGVDAIVVEHALAGHPAALAASADEPYAPALGQPLVLFDAPPRQPLVGDYLSLGHTALTDAAPADSAWRSQTGRFSILIDVESVALDAMTAGIHRLLRDYAPAHTEYRLVAVGGSELGLGSSVGVGLRVSDFRPMKLGGHATLGSTIAITPGRAVRLERNSRITNTEFRLI